MNPSNHQPLAFTTKWAMVLKIVSRDPLTLGLWVLPIVWTLLLAFSLWATITQLNTTVHDLALVAARTSFQRDLLIRQWAANHGGVYVPVTDRTPPNPYLTNVPERDITTPSGRQLTLMNPAYITRQLYELGREIDHSSGHITSLNPVRPENAPDDWERQALAAFERGVTEVSAIENLDGEAHLRLMRPLVTNESCLPCHAAQGYQVGDIRGGISVAVPVKDYAAIVAPNQRSAVVIHGSIWAMGLGLIVAGLWQIRRRRREREQATAALRESEARFRSYFELPLAGRAITSPDKGWLAVNATLCDMLGYNRAELMQTTWAGLTHPDDLAADQTQFNRVIAGEIDGYTLEKRFICKDGRIVPADLAVQCVRRPDRSVDYFVALIQDITDRKRIEAALRQSEEKHRILFTHSPDAYLIITDGVFIDCNRAAEAMLGGERTQIIGQPPAALSPEFQPDGRRSAEAASARIAEALSAGASTFEWVHRRMDGSDFLVEVSISAMPLEGRPALFVTWRDITARKRAEEALRQSEARWLSIIKTSPDGICLTSVDGVIQYTSDKLLVMHGCERPDEMIGRSILEFLVPDYRAAAGLRLAAMLHGDYPGVTEYQVIRRDGGRFYVEINAEVLRDAAGQPTGLLLVERDVDHRKRAEEALRRQNQYLVALQETTLELSAQLDLDRLFEHIVTRAAALVGAAGGFFDMVAPATHQLLPRVGVGVLAESLHHTAKPGEGVAGIVWQTGQPMVVNDYDRWAGRIGGFSHGKLGSLIGVPLLNKGQTLGVLGLAYEFNSPRTFGPEVVEILTQFARLAAIAIQNARLFEAVQQELAERTRAEAALQDLNATLEQRVIDRTAELQAANARLVELDRLKDEFLSRISHELRTPLTSIKIYLELLEKGKPERRDKYLQTLKSETDRLHTLIEEVLMFSQFNLNTTPAIVGPVDLNNLISGRLTTWERLSAGRGLTLHLDLAPDLPRARADAELVAQALLRLVANAVNYTPAGSITVSTATRLDDGRRWVTISVSDTGPGITPEDIPHIFDRFYRGHAAANYKTPGVGVGLSISREIAQRQGGRLTVETQVGVGSTFTLWLPEA